MPSPLNGLSVFVATPCTRDIHVATVRSYIETQAVCQRYGVKLEVGFFTGSLVHHARTIAAWQFLKTGHNRLFWIDSDIEWSGQDFIRALAHSMTKDCVAGVYPARRDDPPGYFVKLMPDGPKPDDEGLLPILGTGLGFACIQRRVMEALSAKAPKHTYGGVKEKIPSVFRCDDDGNEARGEDYAFWADVLDAGFTIWADTKAELGHVGAKVFRYRTL